MLVANGYAENLIEGYHHSRLEEHPLTFAIKYIKENLYAQINIKTIVDKAFMSKATFFRQFKHYFGLTPIAYIHWERIKESQHLLKKTNKSIAEIGYQLGYNSSSYFTAQFEKLNSCTPSEYRRNKNYE